MGSVKDMEHEVEVGEFAVAVLRDEEGGGSGRRAGAEEEDDDKGTSALDTSCWLTDFFISLF
eukprot:CAMPEP_0113315806 /NCGR_PEP_ID=MMETSP0010_2-20120614/11329_1 /TAXON_ID=216773 ORGANISM="Corethron hystrix, Strain 308" /NCGR_SAMPLE_ID=MMETSP0010_2 /ASSEMBLY_ACC=CAM_ASM_000155 /LENGTH=61 /DNA_ID=CAMNT_0000172385 /DNA_START=859 /DNA_END=1044 /DNA_ORIENTATION=+ /assembly_acc=CAM_ASM_000155